MVELGPDVVVVDLVPHDAELDAFLRSLRDRPRPFARVLAMSTYLESQLTVLPRARRAPPTS
jgi:hypothetical protein